MKHSNLWLKSLMLGTAFLALDASAALQTFGYISFSGGNTGSPLPPVYAEQTENQNLRAMDLSDSQTYCVQNGPCIFVSATAKALVDYGINRSYAATLGPSVTVQGQGTFYTGSTALAFSQWSDMWTVSGPPNGSGKITLSGVVDGTLTSGAQGNPLYQLYIFPGLSVPQFTLTDSLANTDSSKTVAVPWNYTFDAPFNVPFSISVRLDAQTISGDASSSNFYDTAKISLIQVPAGTSLSAQSGALIIRTNGSGYFYAAAVPEPTSYALLAAGLGLIGLASRKRREHA